MSGQLDSYRARAFELQESEALLIDPPKRIVIQPWWQDTVPQPLGLSKETLPVGVGQLTQIALVSSPYVQSLLTEPKIRRNDLVIADAEFDTAAFVEAKFADTNEPIGDTLTTGFLNGRFRDETYTSAAGLRRRARTGATWEVAQRSGFQDNNSTFLIPNPQGTSRLEINFTQPLLKDGGRAVNNVQVLLARIDIQLANSEVRAGLQKHLTDVTQSYWDLYQARAEWLQRKKLLAGAARLRDVLDARGQVDSLQRQIFRAEAAVASRRSDLVRAEARIRDAQAELRLLTGDPRLFQVSLWELTPQDRPLSEPVEVSVREATITALDNRPDIAQSIRKVQAASAKVGAAKNQVLPRLDLILSTYVAGLDDQRDMFGAWERQFTEGRPSYAAGLLFEIPIGNRASEARLHRNRWELTRSVYEFQQTAEIAFTDVEVAVRETHTAFNEMLAKKASIDAAEREVAYLQQRWEQLPDPNESAVLLIENLLDAQERLADEEQSLVRAQVAYAMSWVQLRKQMGVLLRFDEPLQASPLQNQMIESQPEIREAQRPAYLMQGAAR
ncbi:MAG: TolC family protein [Planctomycetota bacterium]